MSDDKILEHFQESFLSEIESHLLEADDIHTTIVEATVFVFLFKVELT